jgi:hypothetical protein
VLAGNGCDHCLSEVWRKSWPIPQASWHPSSPRLKGAGKDEPIPFTAMMQACKKIVLSSGGAVPQPKGHQVRASESMVGWRRPSQRKYTHRTMASSTLESMPRVPRAFVLQHGEMIGHGCLLTGAHHFLFLFRACLGRSLRICVRTPRAMRTAFFASSKEIGS